MSRARARARDRNARDRSDPRRRTFSIRATSRLDGFSLFLVHSHSPSRFLPVSPSLSLLSLLPLSPSFSLSPFSHLFRLDDDEKKRNDEAPRVVIRFPAPPADGVGGFAGSVQFTVEEYKERMPENQTTR